MYGTFKNMSAMDKELVALIAGFSASNEKNASLDDKELELLMRSFQEEQLANPSEGPVMLAASLIGTAMNVICLVMLYQPCNFRMSHDYIFLLRAQALLDLLYLIISIPQTSIIHLPNFSDWIFRSFYACQVLTWIFPLVQITLTGSVYVTLALAVERYLSIRERSQRPNVTRAFPCQAVVAAVIIFSVAINLPRFFEMEVVREDNSRYVVRPAAKFNTRDYFIVNNVLCSFLFTLFGPFLILATLNGFIIKRLKHIWAQRTKMGLKEKRNMWAASSLAVVVVLFFACHSLKIVISGYQVFNWIVSNEANKNNATLTANTTTIADVTTVASTTSEDELFSEALEANVTVEANKTMEDMLIAQFYKPRWSHWVENYAYASHLLLALNASVNILIYCTCDQRFYNVLKAKICCCLSLLHVGDEHNVSQKGTNNNGEEDLDEEDEESPISKVILKVMRWCGHSDDDEDPSAKIQEEEAGDEANGLVRDEKKDQDHSPESRLLIVTGSGCRVTEEIQYV